MEFLKFFSILLKDFIVISGIDTKRWMLFHFATVPKIICCFGSSYEIYHPDKVNNNISLFQMCFEYMYAGTCNFSNGLGYISFQIFSRVEYRKIEANASRYKPSFYRIGVLSVYEEIFSLYSKKCLLLFKLGSLLKKVKGENSEFTPVSCVFPDNEDYL
jgi:hypothetical protein